MLTRICNKCQTEKSIGDFYQNKSRSNGLSAYCRKCIGETGAAYRRANRDKTNEYSRQSRQRCKEEALEAYGAICVCCGSTYEPHLTLDHVNGGGYQERKSRAGTPTWRIARQENYPNRFQIMCYNCNSAKHLLGKCGCQGC